MSERKNEAKWLEKYQRWQINVQRDGKRKTFYSKTPGTKGKIDAEKQADKWLKGGFENPTMRFSKLYELFLAEKELPEEERYDGYIQLENGVGMLRLLRTEFMEAMADAAVRRAEEETVTIATGVLAAPTIQGLTEIFMKSFPEKQVQVIPIINHFFGEQITVSGLLTGHDIIEQLKGKELGNRLLLPCNLLRSGEEVFLDDVTLAQVESALQVKIDIVKSSGQDLLSCLMR